MPNGGPLDDKPQLLAKAERLYAPFAKTVEEFIASHKLDPLGHYKWYHGTSQIILKRGRRTDKHIYIVFNLEKESILITAGAVHYTWCEPYQCTQPMRLDFHIVKEKLPCSPELLKHYLEIAWRIACSIHKRELLEIEDWRNDVNRQARLLFPET